jgi:serine/threonine protein kinase
MHELTLIHTDLKPENILLVSSEYVKVPDYKVKLIRKCKIHHSRYLSLQWDLRPHFDVNLKFALSFS